MREHFESNHIQLVGLKMSKEDYKSGPNLQISTRRRRRNTEKRKRGSNDQAEEEVSKRKGKGKEKEQPESGHAILESARLVSTSEY